MASFVDVIWGAEFPFRLLHTLLVLLSQAPAVHQYVFQRCVSFQSISMFLICFRSVFPLSLGVSVSFDWFMNCCHGHLFVFQQLYKVTALCMCPSMSLVYRYSLMFFTLLEVSIQLCCAGAPRSVAALRRHMVDIISADNRMDLGPSDESIHVCCSKPRHV